MSKHGMGLLRYARLTRRQFIMFAVVTAMLNGMVTATVGSWLAHGYSAHQERAKAVENIANLVYERRIRAGMVVWSLRRNAEIEEVRYRKRAYDEAFVEWNKKVQLNTFTIRAITGERNHSPFEQMFEDMLVPALSEVDRCLTKAYDIRILGGDPKPTLEACQMASLHQFTLDCGATFTNELYKLTRLTLVPWSGPDGDDREMAMKRIKKGCAREIMPAPAPGATTPGPSVSSPAPSPTATAVSEPTAGTPATAGQPPEH